MNTPFFDNLFDDFGIWQHTDGEKILRREGYALDDATRGLLACLALHKTTQAEILFQYIVNSRHNSGFYGYATQNRQFIKSPASDDMIGQVIWALGYAINQRFHADEAKKMINSLATTLFNMSHVRGYAYGVLGSIYIDKPIAQKMMQSLLRFFPDISDDWIWPEPIMTYGNGIIPYAFLRYGSVMHDKDAQNFGFKLLKFIEEKCTQGRIRGPIGNNGWLPKESVTVPDYSQQPIDAAYMIWAWVAAYEVFNDQACLEKAEQWMDWFSGNNIAKTPMFDQKTLACFDGIDSTGVHYHSGAESNICFLLSKQILESKNTV